MEAEKHRQEEKEAKYIEEKKKSNLVTDWIVGGWGHKTK
jgi:hypothetical protein